MVPWTPFESQKIKESIWIVLGIDLEALNPCAPPICGIGWSLAIYNHQTSQKIILRKGDWSIDYSKDKFGTWWHKPEQKASLDYQLNHPWRQPGNIVAFEFLRFLCSMYEMTKNKMVLGFENALVDAGLLNDFLYTHTKTTLPYVTKKYNPAMISMYSEMMGIVSVRNSNFLNANESGMNTYIPVLWNEMVTQHQNVNPLLIHIYECRDGQTLNIFKESDLHKMRHVPDMDVTRTLILYLKCKELAMLMFEIVKNHYSNLPQISTPFMERNQPVTQSQGQTHDYLLYTNHRDFQSSTYDSFGSAGSL